MIEAGIYECDDFEPHPTFKKFAELIVKECALIVAHSPWRLTHGYKAIDQANLVKQHFGVK
jgi:hypothetical protein